MTKRRRAVKPPQKPIVKTVILPDAGVVKVIVPKGIVPVVATDHAKGILEIVPVKRVELKKRSWWELMFG